jgi:hypothetical protein
MGADPALSHQAGSGSDFHIFFYYAIRSDFHGIRQFRIRRNYRRRMNFRHVVTSVSMSFFRIIKKAGQTRLIEAYFFFAGFIAARALAFCLSM